MHELLKNYPVVIPCQVDWGHMDAFQHVNNIIFFRYFENVRVEYGIRIGITEDMETKGEGPILGHAECKYIKPLFFPDTALTGVRVSAIRGSDMHMLYKIVSQNRNEVVAVGTTIGVYYDYRAKHRIDFPQKLIDRMEKLEGRKLTG